MITSVCDGRAVSDCHSPFSVIWFFAGLRRACWLRVWAGNFVTEDDVFLNEMGVHCHRDFSRVHISLFADDEVGSWRGRRVRACELTVLSL